MNKILLLLLFIIPLSLFGQVESQFNGTLNVFSASRIGFTNTFTISGIFSSTTTSYTSANSAVGDIVQVQSGSRFYWLHIYSIASNSGGVITGNVRDSSSTLTTFPTGKWSIFRPTPNLRLPLSPDGETNASRSATFNTLALRVDEIQTSVASATNCELTITKANHGFRKWTPVFWNGSTYIRPTNDTIVPDYIVVDSLTANTFKVATCGTYTTTLTNGLYWFTNVSPGYSLTPDTTKVPLFQVIDSTLLLNPIVGFNLMSGGGGTADGNGIYSGSDSLSQENTYAAMASDGSQNFGLGYWPSFPGRDYINSEYGLFVNPQVWGEVSVVNKNTYLSVYEGLLYGAASKNNIETSRLYMSGNGAVAWLEARKYNNTRSSIIGVDSVSAFIGENLDAGNKYRLPYVNDTGGLPSTTSGVTNILKWTAGVPSFGYRYETDTLVGDVYLKSSNVEDFVEQTIAIGNFPTFPNYSANQSKQGLILSPYNEGINSLMMFFSGTGTTLDVGNSSGRIRYLRDTRELSSVGVSTATVLLSARPLLAPSTSATLSLDSVAIRYNPLGGNEFILFPNANPTVTSSAISTLINTGTGSATTPSFLRSQHGVATGTTDGSGDLTVTFAAAMPDATYSLIATAEGTTYYTTTVHTKATGTVKVRFFDAAGAAVTATSVTISYEAKDY